VKVNEKEPLSIADNGSEQSKQSHLKFLLTVV